MVSSPWEQTPPSVLSFQHEAPPLHGLAWAHTHTCVHRFSHIHPPMALKGLWFCSPTLLHWQNLGHTASPSQGRPRTPANPAPHAAQQPLRPPRCSATPRTLVTVPCPSPEAKLCHPWVPHVCCPDGFIPWDLECPHPPYPQGQMGPGLTGRQAWASHTPHPGIRVGELARRPTCPAHLCLQPSRLHSHGETTPREGQLSP